MTCRLLFRAVAPTRGLLRVQNDRARSGAPTGMDDKPWRWGPRATRELLLSRWPPTSRLG